MLRVRFAPSPTGFLHVGSASTFIFNWLYARHNGGTMVLRIDDTDVDRNTEASLDSIFDGLRWLDLDWDEEYSNPTASLSIARSPRRYFRKVSPIATSRPPIPETPKSVGRRIKPGFSMPACANSAREESDRRAAAGEPFVLRFRVPRDTARNVNSSDAVYGCNPNPPPTSKTSRCSAATASRPITWRPAPTTSISTSATSSAARIISPTPSSTS